MTEERIRLVFQVLDKVSPQLGTFSRLMGLLGAELHGKNDNLFCLHCWYWASCISRDVTVALLCTRVFSGYPYPPTSTHWEALPPDHGLLCIRVYDGYPFPPLLTHWRFLPHQPEVYFVQDYGGYPFPPRSTLWGALPPEWGLLCTTVYSGYLYAPKVITEEPFYPLRSPSSRVRSVLSLFFCVLH